MTNHLGTDVDGVEHLTVVDTDLGTAHLGNNKHVTKVGSDNSGLLVSGSLLLGLAELLDEAHRLALQAARKASASTGVDDFHEVLGGHVEKSIKLMSTVRELAECAPFLELGGFLSVVRVHDGL